MSMVERFSTCRVEGERWGVVDQTRGDRVVGEFRDERCAEVIAALMNGDVDALCSASADMASRSRRAVAFALGSPILHARAACGDRTTVALL